MSECAGLTRRVEDSIMGDLLQPWHLIVLAVVAFLLFGAKRLPEMGKGLGEGLKGFKEGLKGITDAPPPPPQHPKKRPPTRSRASQADRRSRANSPEARICSSALVVRSIETKGLGHSTRAFVPLKNNRDSPA
jgi:sec-independent protein translocase protein TatA